MDLTFITNELLRAIADIFKVLFVMNKLAYSFYNPLNIQWGKRDFNNKPFTVSLRQCLKMLSTIKIKSLVQNGGDTSKDIQRIKGIKSQSPRYEITWIFCNRLVGKENVFYVHCGNLFYSK